MKNAIVMVLLAITANLSVAQEPTDISFEVAAGVSHYANDVDDLWYQLGFNHKKELTSLGVEAGFTQTVANFHQVDVSWHADWVYLGSNHIEADVTPSDANYNTTTHGCNGKCWPLAHLVGGGHDDGVKASVETSFTNAEGYRFGAELGPYLHRDLWDVAAYNSVTAPTGTTPFTKYMQNAHEWQVVPMFGISIQRNNWYLKYEHFSNGGSVSDPLRAAWLATHFVTVGYKF